MKMSSDLDRNNELDSLKSEIYKYFINGPELEFLVDLVKNFIIFVIIFIIAIGLHAIVSWSSENKYPWFIVNGLWLIENILFAGDIIWFGCKIAVSTIIETIRIFRRSH
jgi:hypothetical protein